MFMKNHARLIEDGPELRHVLRLESHVNQELSTNLKYRISAIKIY